MAGVDWSSLSPVAIAAALITGVAGSALYDAARRAPGVVMSGLTASRLSRAQSKLKTVRAFASKPEVASRLGARFAAEAILYVSINILILIVTTAISWNLNHSNQPEKLLGSGIWLAASLTAGHLAGRAHASITWSILMLDIATNTNLESRLEEAIQRLSAQ